MVLERNLDLYDVFRLVNINGKSYIFPLLSHVPQSVVDEYLIDSSDDLIVDISQSYSEVK